MRQSMRVTVICYVSRKKLSLGSVWTYEVWIVLDVWPDGDEGILHESAVRCARAADAEKLRERLMEAANDSLAGQVEDTVWKINDDLSENQVAGLIAGMPDTLKTLVQEPLSRMEAASGVPAPAVPFGADVTVNFALRPVLQPMEKVIHAFEVVGIVIGLATGLHSLVISCAKPLLHDKASSALASVFEKLENQSATGLKEVNKPSEGPVGFGLAAHRSGLDELRRTREEDGRRAVDGDNATGPAASGFDPY